ncbi:BQ5605_C005g03368 [Microbotryum silenes-dioicae]|uniref:BQ5605_C005g03368 protein n=1 Tax=Microbotryum silenes-dioicae TaxID=796604 RepID=A0A2X0PCC7_9BASI|nr:BQ5605_C005g03368 [Microbotryum silenes-dioicae]
MHAIPGILVPLLLCECALALSLRSSPQAELNRPSDSELIGRQSMPSSGRAGEAQDRFRLPDVPEQDGPKMTSTEFYPLLPPAIPLAVKSPYLNAWLPTGNDRQDAGHLAGHWPRFWPISYPHTERGYRLGWSGMIRIDSNQTYVFLGDPGSTPGLKRSKMAAQTRFEYTASRSIFSFKAGGVHFNVTFVSPITPEDLISTSLPLSDLVVEIDSKSLKHHHVEVYTDITGEWATADSNAPITWDFVHHSAAGIHLVRRRDELLFEEINEQAEWGSAVYATEMSHSTRAGSGPARKLRKEFAEQGRLSGALDAQYRAVNDDQPVFGFSAMMSPQKPSVTFTIGHMRTPYVNYVTSGGQVNLDGYWMTQFPTFTDAVAGWIKNGSAIHAAATSFDRKLRRDAIRVSGKNYAAVVELSARQAFATFEITSGGKGEGDTVAFLKEISSNGDMSAAYHHYMFLQTVDVIFPLYPILAYAQPKLIKLLLEPLLRYATSGLYPNQWPCHDLGTYPNARGYNDGNDEAMPVEEAGNLLWMVLAYVQLSHDVEFVEEYYHILTQWTAFLIQDGLIPAEQLSTDDFAGTLSNQTNLAVKAIVGIGAMGGLAAKTGRWVESIHYGATAKAYAAEWYDLALTPKPIDLPHAKLAYQDENSHGLLYNLFGDRALNLGIFDRQLYEWQSKFYTTLLQPFGVPLDSRHLWTKSDWEMFASASSTSRDSRDMFVDSIVKYLKAGKVDAAFPDLYETTDGNFPGRGLDWPIEGHFSLLALDVANKANGVKRDPFRGNDLD